VLLVSIFQHDAGQRQGLLDELLSSTLSGLSSAKSAPRHCPAQLDGGASIQMFSALVIQLVQVGAGAGPPAAGCLQAAACRLQAAVLPHLRASAQGPPPGAPQELLLLLLLLHRLPAWGAPPLPRAILGPALSIRFPVPSTHTPHTPLSPAGLRSPAPHWQRCLGGDERFWLGAHLGRQDPGVAAGQAAPGQGEQVGHSRRLQAVHGELRDRWGGGGEGGASCSGRGCS
jgi:hypothetical protein